MAEWTTLCAVDEAPRPGDVREVDIGGRTLCFANVEGTLRALDNLCPHRDGPLGQGWIEGETVVCPWHAWAFDCRTGIAEAPERAQVKVYPVQIANGLVLVDLAAAVV